MNTFRLRFVCADESEYDGQCVSVNVPLTDGSAGIFAGHANLVAAMPEGELRIDTGGEVIEYAVTEGLVKVENGEVLIMAYSAERPEEIDEKRARDAADRARLKLKKQRSELEYRQAQADLSRAMNRLKVKHRG